MKGIHSFLFLLHSSLLLAITTVKIPQHIIPENAGTLKRLDLPQYQGVEEAQKTNIPTYYDFFGLQDASHTNMESHIAYDRDIMHGTDLEESPPDCPTHSQDGTGVPDQPVGLYSLDEIGTHKRLHTKPNLPCSDDVVTHTAKYRHNLDFDLGTQKSLTYMNKNERNLETYPNEVSQGIVKELNRLHELKSVDQAKFLDLLQKEGELAVKESSALYEEICSTFGILIRSAKLRSGETQDDNENLLESIQKIKTEFFTRFIGGLMIIFQSSQTKPSIDDLIIEAWDTLFQELKGAILLPYNNTKQITSIVNHDSLITCLLQPTGGNSISPELMMSLIDKWAGKASYNHQRHEIELGTSASTSEVSPLKQGQQMKHKSVEPSQDLRYGDTSSVQIGNIHINSSHTRENLNQGPLNAMRYRCIDFLIKLGLSEIEIPKTLKERIATFFVTLKNDILACIKDTKWSTNIGNSSLSKTSFIKIRVCDTIKLMHEQITPAFLAILWLTHQDQVKDTSWNSLCLNGWTFLEGFFLSWKKIVLKNPGAELWQSRRELASSFDGSGSQGPAHYMKFIQSRGYLTNDPLWYLVNQWYEKLKVQPGSIVGALGYKLDPPSKTAIDYIHNKQNKRNITGKKRKLLRSETTQRGDETLPFDPSPKLGRFLCYYGAWKMEDKVNFSDEIRYFFSTLKQELFKAFETAQKVYFNNKPYSSNSILNKYMIINAIQTAESQVLPQFVAIVILLYKNQAAQSLRKAVCQSGWQFVKAYFSGWKGWLQEYPLQAMVLLNKGNGTNGDWSDMQYSFHYMAKHVLKDSVPLNPAWFLIEEWYKMQVDAEGITFSALGFNLPPPVKKNLKDITKKYQFNI